MLEFADSQSRNERCDLSSIFARILVLGPRIEWRVGRHLSLAMAPQKYLTRLVPWIHNNDLTKITKYHHKNHAFVKHLHSEAKNQDTALWLF